LRAVAAYLRTHVVEKIIGLGGDYVQMDAPNYAQWHVDPTNRAAFESWGHDMSAELVADAEIDNEVFAGVSGITRAMHVCRGNAPGGRWLANYNKLLLEFDTPRAGGFEPLKHVRENAEVVLGLFTTKQGALEDLSAVETRVREASKTIGLERLEISPQCGFASGEAGNPLRFCPRTTLASKRARLPKQSGRLLSDRPTFLSAPSHPAS
jgi:5-methyltetrahydropteroyltriglutamate--homocysteine methyltransferase